MDECEIKRIKAINSEIIDNISHFVKLIYSNLLFSVETGKMSGSEEV